MSIFTGTRKKRFLVRVLLIFCVLFFLVLSAAGYFLKRGVSVESLTVGGVVVSDCRLIWKKKLDLQIAEILVSKAEKSQQSTSGSNAVGKGIRAGYYLAKFFSRLSIGKIVVGEKSFSVHLNQEKTKPHTFILESEDIVFQSRLLFNKDTLDVEIIEAVSSQFNSGLTGKVQLSGKDVRATGSLSVLINETFPVALDFIADKQQLSFHGKEAGKITNIAALVDLFGLSQNIQRWITDYLSGSRYHLKSFKGILPWKNPKEILTTLEAEVRVDDTEYTFAPGLEPIKAQYTDVTFASGVLDIKPHAATFYGQDCESSWLDINFNDTKNILLTAYIQTHAVANDDILTLLNHYKIKLPFKQVAGKTATDLQLAINLRKKLVVARGVFEIVEGAIEWGSKQYQVKDARIKLDRSTVQIDQLQISYGTLLTAQVAGGIELKKKKGDLNIQLEQLSLKIGNSQFGVNPKKPAKIKYSFDPTGHFIEAQPSSWLLDSLGLSMGAFSAPVSLNDLAMDLPSVSVQTSSGILSEISGYFSIKKKIIDLSCDLIGYHVKDLQLMDAHLPIDIDYDKQGLVITTGTTSVWNLSKMPLTLYPSRVRYGDDVFTIDESRISYGAFFDSHLTGFYNKREQKGLFHLDKIDVTNENLEKKLQVGSKADVEISGVDGKFVVYVPTFELKISTDKEKNWSASFGDLSKTYSRSKIQQKFKIKDGSLVLSSANGQRPYALSANITAPYPLLIEDGNPVKNWHILGRIADDGVYAMVNNDFALKYFDKSLSIDSKWVGYNISSIIKMLKEFKEASLAPSPSPVADPEVTQSLPPDTGDPGDGKSFLLRLTAENSQIYVSPNSRVLADDFQLDFQKGKLLMQLHHGTGKILLHLDQGKFFLDGSNLDDEFMGAFIQDSSFQGGRMSVTSSGSLNEFSLLVDIKETILNELASLNNVMAFLNTAPALATFSLPEYDTRGMPIQSAVIGMKFKDKVATFESIEIESPVLDGKGKGGIDFVNRLIDIDIFLKTQAGKNIGKIPAVGFVLAGDDDDASLVLKIEGSFDDPEVKTSLVKDVFLYPVELLFRTIKLPVHLLEKNQKRFWDTDEEVMEPVLAPQDKEELLSE